MKNLQSALDRLPASRASDYRDILDRLPDGAEGKEAIEGLVFLHVKVLESASRRSEDLKRVSEPRPIGYTPEGRPIYKLSDRPAVRHAFGVFVGE